MELFEWIQILHSICTQATAISSTGSKYQLIVQGSAIHCSLLFHICTVLFDGIRKTEFLFIHFII